MKEKKEEKFRDDIIAKLLSLQHYNGCIYSNELEKQFNVSGTIIRDHVRKLRRSGIPITNDDGYGFAKNIEEIMPTINDMKNRATSQLYTIYALYRNFVKPNSQEELFNPNPIEEIISMIKKEFLI